MKNEIQIGRPTKQDSEKVRSRSFSARPQDLQRIEELIRKTGLNPTQIIRKSLEIFYNNEIHPAN